MSISEKFNIGKHGHADKDQFDIFMNKILGSPGVCLELHSQRGYFIWEMITESIRMGIDELRS